MVAKKKVKKSKYGFAIGLTLTQKVLRERIKILEELVDSGKVKGKAAIRAGKLAATYRFELKAMREERAMASKSAA